MNKELMEVFRLYTTGTHQELNEYLIGKSKDTLIGILVDMLTMYINDKNSSTVREFITVTLAGYQHVEKKIGYNGYKQNSFSGTVTRCEAKPKNIDTNSQHPDKLKGYGNFSDYTFNRFSKDKMEEGLNMLVSGFVDGKLVYIIEFPFSCPGLITKLETQLFKRFPSGEDIKNEYLRSANFDYRDFYTCKDLKIIYLLTKKKLEAVKPHIVRDFYIFLESRAK